MDLVTVSPKYQVVIPKAVRDELGIVPGQRVHAVAVDGRIELIPIARAAELRGWLRGIDATVPRDDDRP
jgi:AbrB family looped-hinge helix DNA binding protein